MEEFHLHAYDSAAMYKERMKFVRDKKILKQEFKSGDLVLLFNPKLKLFSDKLNSTWSSPFKVVNVSPYGAIELESEDGTRTFKVVQNTMKQGARTEENKEKKDSWSTETMRLHNGYADCIVVADTVRKKCKFAI
ncbi:uncharacterized protein [Nicotiana sylvestris]|uniref:uncharacterized protein n=1 Tax=Nicotiana sylvestris TaxID=4096 RepID=UPI00388C6300